MRGYFGIGVYQPKTAVNVGTLMRSAYSMDAAFVFTIGCRYQRPSSDTVKSWRHIPLYQFESFNDFRLRLPYRCPVVGVEITGEAHPLDSYVHPERAIYLLGAEDGGLPDVVMVACQQIIQIPHCKFCLNVSVAGSIVMYDRKTKEQSK